MNLIVRNSAHISAERQAVYACFWDPELWPHVNRHVRRVEMLECGTHRQRFRMTVESSGREYITESIRTGDPGRSIRYWQLRRPDFFIDHHGRWTFLSNRHGTTVVLEHRVRVDVGKACESLGVNSAATARAIIRDTLARNGRSTIAGLKQLLETATPVTLPEVP